MSSPGLRVFFSRYAVSGGTRVQGMLLPRSDTFFDPPPIAGLGATEDEVLALLERELAAVAARHESTQRYVWTEQLTLRRVSVDVPPRTRVGGKEVIGARPLSLRVPFVFLALEGGGFEVRVPQLRGALVLESLDGVGQTLSALLFAIFVGEDASWLYDLRVPASEEVREWSPLTLAQLLAPRSTEDALPIPAHLDKVSDDWTARAKRGQLPPVIGALPAFDELASVLAREQPPSLLLVGPRGVGKTTSVRRLAQRLAEANRRRGVPKRRLWASSADRILAGMAYLGMWQERCLALVSELTDTGDYFYVDRLADLMRPQSDGSSIADLLAPAIQSGEIRIIAECDEGELHRCRNRAPALLDSFHIIRLEAPTRAHVLALIQAYSERRLVGGFTAPGARKLIQLLDAFRRDQSFPGKAFLFLEWWRLQHGSSSSAGPGDVLTAYARWSGLPLEIVSDQATLSTGLIAEALERGVIGQPDACEIAARTVLRLKAGLNDPERPVATLLFTGPTGVGKTELAKRIAEYLFGDSRRLIRVDMSEYQVPGSASRLTAAHPDSLVGRVQREPLSVVLLDELEKAHPHVFDVLLPMLGEGRLTDSQGKLADFRMAVVLMTSNLGGVGTSIGFGDIAGHAEHAVSAAVRRHFRPELFARLDHVVAFRSLTPEHVHQIVGLMLQRLRERPGLRARDIDLGLTTAARNLLAARGFDPKLGARPLQRLLEETVIAPLAVRMARDPSWSKRTVMICTKEEAARGLFPDVLALEGSMSPAGM